MGILIWALAGLAGFGVARLIALGRRPARLLEATFCLSTAGAAGILATRLDFGGWREPDPRAALFALLVSFAGAALFRTAAALLSPQLVKEVR